MRVLPVRAGLDRCQWPDAVSLVDALDLGREIIEKSLLRGVLIDLLFQIQVAIHVLLRLLLGIKLLLHQSLVVVVA